MNIENKTSPKCRNVPHCSRHCHPMIGCDRNCKDRRVCEPGKYASKND